MLRQAGRYFEFAACLGLNFFERNSLLQLCQFKLTIISIDSEDCELRDDLTDGPGPGKRKGTLFQDFGTSILCTVLHNDDNFGFIGVGDKVHCSTNT